MLKIAKTAGFCFGVKNAVEIAKKSLKQDSVCSLGNIINNPVVVNNLKEKGLRVVESVSEVKDFEVLIIRSHGVGPHVYDEIKKKKIRFHDATCPFVKRIHKLVHKASNEGKTILIAGDFNHPEVEGIRGYCNDNYFVFSNLFELQNIFTKFNLKDRKLFVISQTTLSLKVWKECERFIKKNYEDAKINCSICFATKNRQIEAEQLSKNSDFAIVVGGHNSSNTKKLYDICKQNCKTFFIQDESDIEKIVYDFKNKEGFITAGASTPNFLISRIFAQISNKI